MDRQVRALGEQQNQQRAAAHRVAMVAQHEPHERARRQAEAIREQANAGPFMPAYDFVSGPDAVGSEEA